MEEKEGAGTKLEAFFAGKGFYIVLLLCVAVIGVSAWSMFSTGSGSETPEDFSVAVAHMDDLPVVTVLPLPSEEPFDAAIMEEEPEEDMETAALEGEAEPETAAETAETEDVPVSVDLEAVPMTEEATVPAEAEAVAPSDEGVQARYFIWPVNGEIVSPYSMDMPVFNRTMQDWRTHDGVDIAADIGENVRAAAAGTVKAVYEDERMGMTVVLDHGGGVESLYANLAGVPAVKVSEQVSVGQILGAVGDTALYETAETSHLHFSMTRDGLSADPAEFLPEKSAQQTE